MQNSITLSKQEVGEAIRRYVNWLTGCTPTKIGFDFHVDMPQDWFGPPPTGVSLTGAECVDEVGNGFPAAFGADNLIEDWLKAEAVVEGLLGRTKKDLLADKVRLHSEICCLSKNLLDLLAEIFAEKDAQTLNTV